MPKGRTTGTLSGLFHKGWLIVRADRRLGDIAINSLKQAILEADGNEVFAVGTLSEDGLVEDVRVCGRGHESAVLALSSWYERGDVLIHNHPSGRLAPSEADLSIAARAGEGGLGSFIVDNAVERVYVVAEPIRKRSRLAVDADEAAAVLENGGALSSFMAAYESRPSQIGLLRQVCGVFNQNAILAAEAGTGVGKSFAYLIPAIRWAELNDDRVVISTATINLQQQLHEKDIPFIANVLDSKVKAVLMKGRANYLCLRRLREAQRENELFEEDGASLDAIGAWAETTETGSRSDLPFNPEEAAWSRVCSEADLCLGLRCPERERCFVLRVRREAADARLLVVNHHLLFADLAARSSGAGYDSTVVLPPYERVVLDEAHNIEEAATSFFSEDFTKFSALRQLGRLYRRRRGAETGLALILASLSIVEGRSDAVADSAQRVRDALDAVDAAGVGLTEPSGTFRLAGARDPSLRAFLFEPLAALRLAISQCASAVRDLMEGIGEDLSDDPAVWEAKAILRRLESVGSVCGRFIEYDEHPEEVFWIERRRTAKGDSFARFAATPLDVAPALQESLFGPNKTVACVSATLTVADSFQYWLGRTGISLMAERPVVTGRFPSPFPYDRAVLLASPTDAPLPDEEGYREFVDSAVQALLSASFGSALVLFTSYDALRSAHAAARPALESAGIRCLKQGDDDRARLLKTFLEDESSVLFATDSFWEGVDAPGDTLRLVIICRLPFRSPNEPVFEARREALERRGGNAFMTLSLPEAVMKFRQGFGRLMRRSDDGGVVVVLDGRLLRKRYGEIFIRSLPETKRFFGPSDEMAAEVDRFLSR
jgi:ATP-dependent DNA helicase DinG